MTAPAQHLAEVSGSGQLAKLLVLSQSGQAEPALGSFLKSSPSF